MSVFRRAGLAVLVAGLLTLATAATTAETARQKFAHIEAAKLPAGTRIDFSAAELEAWAADEARIYAPGAARNIRLQTRAGTATGSLMVDFLKLRQATTGEEPGWLMKNLFSGERRVIVTAHFTSRNHRARVDVDRVEVSGVLVQGATLDFLIQNFLRPTFPDAAVDEWFDLGFRIDRFAVSPGGVSVYIGK